MNENQPSSRLLWLDSTKGFVMLWVILFHCTSRVHFIYPDIQFGEGLFFISELGRPLRMPTLFLISGLLLSSSLNMNWREFLNKRVLNLAYLFMLWTLIQIFLKYGTNKQFTEIPYKFIYAIFVEPQNSLWYIAALAIFMMLARACRSVPIWLMLTIATILEVIHIGPYAIYTDNTSRYFIYFLVGLHFKPQISEISNWFNENIKRAVILLVIFFTINIYIVKSGAWYWQGLGLIYSLFALLCMVALGNIIEKSREITPYIADFLAYIGKNSVIFYLGYAPFMVISLTILAKFFMPHHNVVILMMWFLSMFLPWVLWVSTRNNFLSFLFNRPKL